MDRAQRRGGAAATHVLELRGITKAFPGHRRQRPRRLRPPRGRGARAPRRERRRQVDADEHPLRALHGRTPARSALHGEPVTFGSAKDAIEVGIGMVHQHFMLIPVMTVAENIVLGIEPTRDGDAARRARRGARACASCRSSSASPSTPTALISRDHGRPAAARRDPEGALPRRRDPDPRRADGGADAAGGERAVRDRQAASRPTGSRSSSSATS